VSGVFMCVCVCRVCMVCVFVWCCRVSVSGVCMCVCVSDVCVWCLCVCVCGDV